MRAGAWATVAVVALLSTGCVTKGTHELTLQELEQTRGSLSDAEKTIADQHSMIESNEAEIAKNKAELMELLRRKALLEDGYAEAQEQLNDSQNRLNESEAQLEQLRLIEAETKSRNEIYARFVTQLQKMIDGGQLTVSIEQGRIVINLPNNVLFPSGHTSLNWEGQQALKKIAAVLKEFSQRRYQIEGHTDNVPINSPMYPSNWELSSARALSVLHIMVNEGVAPENISAAGFGEFRPRADNATKEGQALNRRIEIIMLPDLDILSNELPKLAQ